jgi:hypothetical protein
MARGADRWNQELHVAAGIVNRFLDVVVGKYPRTVLMVKGKDG